MQNLILSFNVVIPICIMLCLGYFLKIIKLYDEKTLKIMNNVTFRVFLPVLLFYNIYNTKLEEIFNPKFIFFGVFAVVICFLILFAVIPIIEKNNKCRGVLIQGIMRSNFILFGLPVVVSLFGENNVGITAMLIAIVVPIFNILSVVVLEIFRGGKVDFKRTLIGVATNPLIIASAIGMIFLVFNIKIPAIIYKSIGDLSKIATPLALIILGGSFSFSSVRGQEKRIVLGVVGRLVLVPLVFLPIAIHMGFRNVELATFLAMFASPVAVSSFTMAQQMDSDAPLAGQLVVFSSVFSVLTMFFWIFVLKQFNYI